MAGPRRMLSGLPGSGATAGPGVGVLLGVLPFVVMAVVATADLLTGPGTGFLPLLALGPALAAVSIRPGRTALIGVLAMLLCIALAWYDDIGIGGHRGLISLTTIAGVTAAGAVASAGRRQRERELAKVTAVAEAAQRVLLRPVPRQAGPAQLAVRYISATASARIGGDLYEVVVVGDKVRLIVGDVQGKGLAAVQTAAAVLGAFREAVHDTADLPSLAARIELSLQRQAAEEEFVTAILADVAPDGAGIEILNCGHPPPLVLSGPAARFLEPSDVSLPFGLAGLAAGERTVDTVALLPGDKILFYTDGISEARDKTGTFYQLSGCASLLEGLNLDAALDRLCGDVTRHVGHELLDDAALLLISPGPGGQPSGGVRSHTVAGHPDLPAAGDAAISPAGARGS